MIENIIFENQKTPDYKYKHKLVFNEHPKYFLKDNASNKSEFRFITIRKGRNFKSISNDKLNEINFEGK